MSRLITRPAPFPKRFSHACCNTDTHSHTSLPRQIIRSSEGNISTEMDAQKELSCKAWAVRQSQRPFQSEAFVHTFTVTGTRVCQMSQKQQHSITHPREMMPLWIQSVRRLHPARKHLRSASAEIPPRPSKQCAAPPKCAEIPAVLS